MIRTRFAPSPTGPLHLGHAYSAMVAFDVAQTQGGQCLIRIEDLDQSRARPQWEDQIFEDLKWLGYTWPEPVMRQSERTSAYNTALDHLWSLGLLYPCTCSRKDIQSAVEAPQEGGTPLVGPDGIVYPGTCKNKARPQHRPTDQALRLDLAKAFPDPEIHYREYAAGSPTRVTTQREQALQTIGDPVIQRRDMAAAYHLAVVVDDAAQKITHVVRGADLAEATPIHRILQTALKLPEPKYLHHRLIRDDQGKRLAKRDDAKAIRLYRDAGVSLATLRSDLLLMENTSGGF